ncbi:hypothetical protein CC2G_008731 [Coprinopsis cinerea AmutBmut pab1-1]|nr:hypothetical protein CC2G_008731 [Coprinopsis cinerea AmutBmut pab1-1]
MAKNTKKAPPKSTPPITSFFARVSLSQGSASSGAKEGADASTYGTSGSKRGSSPVKSADKLAIPATSAKRERSSTMQSTVSDGNTQPSEQGSTARNIATSSTSRKKARLSSPISIASTSTVPSSQSDEEELTVESHISTSRAPQKSDAAINHWMKEAQPPTPDRDGPNQPLSVDTMDVDEPLGELSGQTTPVSEWATACVDGISSPSATSSAHAATQPPTPPYTDASSDGDTDSAPHIPPISPVDAAKAARERTQRLLSKIEEAQVEFEPSSPEVIPIEVPDELPTDSDDSDSDSDIALPTPPVRATRSSRNASAGPSSENQNLRRSSRQIPPKTKVTVDDRGSPKPRKPKMSKNPILDLLREREKAEKAGKGEQAYRVANDLLANPFMELPKLDLEGEENDMKRYKGGVASLSWKGSLSAMEGVHLDEANRQSWFGDGGGNINDILNRERTARRQEEENERQEGSPLWSQGEGEDMTVDSVLPSLPYSGNSDTIRSVSAAIRAKEFSKAVWVLKSGIFRVLHLDGDANFFSQLCKIALNTQEPALSEAAFAATCQLLQRNHEDIPDTWKLESMVIVETLRQLGAQPSVMASAELPVPASSAAKDIKSADREAILFRALTIVQLAARCNRVAVPDVSNIVVCFLLVGLDSSTPPELRREISATINLLCHLLSADKHLSSECKLASRLVGLVKDYHPANKALLLSFIFAGTGNTLRISRMLAYAILLQVPAKAIVLSTYRDPPPLTRLVGLLVQQKSDDSNPPGIFQVHEQTDYSNMRRYLYIFGVAMSNIEPYVEEQKQSALKASHAPGAVPRSPSKKKPVGDMELLHTAFEILHGMIDDVRAAHIDRSRAKAVLKQLQMRIYYQRSMLHPSSTRRLADAD